MIERRRLLAGALCLATTTMGAAIAQRACAQGASPDKPADAATKSEQGPKPMTDRRVAIYDIYLSAWSAIPDEKRRRLLGESVTDAVVFRNPMQTRDGMEDLIRHLEGFQQRSPGGKFISIAMLGWDNNALATWQFVDGEGKPGFTGYDVLEFDAQGRITSIVLFGNSPKLTLK